MNEFIEQFLLESRELVEQATGDLLALEENPRDVERLDSVFRAFHTLKGSAAIVDFAAMARATHAVEDVLARVRAGKAILSRALVNDCLSCLDQVVQWLDGMALDGQVPADSAVRAETIVQRFVSNEKQKGSTGDGTTTLRSDDAQDIRSGDLTDAARSLMEAQRQLLLNEGKDGFYGRMVSAGRVAINILKSSGRRELVSGFENALAQSAAAGDVSSLLTVIGEVLHGGADGKVQPASGGASDTTARVLRVDVERIDAIVNLTGELTVAKNAVGHAVKMAQSGRDPKALALMLKDQHSTLERLVVELQRLVLGIRVLPLRHVFQRFPRLVREISETLGKPTKLVMEGDATEADKVIVENLFEPLLHIVRNALDHGVENQADRAAAGKSAMATIVLRAKRTGDHVLVEVEDDGRGIDVARIRAVAQNRGLVEADMLAAMKDEEIIDLIFAAGFSTAEQVTDLSGRGVGMNVVRNGVERLGGSATLSSRSGQGTIVALKMPFSVMMTPVMTVEAGGQIFGIPLENVVETASVARARISAVGAARAFVLRDRTIPVIDLAQSVGADGSRATGAEAKVVVVNLGGHFGSLEVDRIGDRMDVMLKPMDGLLSGMRGVAGTSVLGDGGILIVLNLEDLLQ